MQVGAPSLGRSTDERVPVVRDDTSAPFFEGTEEGKFLIRRCLPAGHLSRPQARQCSTCGATELEWTEAAGSASLVSWAVLSTEPLAIVAIGDSRRVRGGGPGWSPTTPPH